MANASPLQSQSPITISAPGYEAGTLDSYAGIHVKATAGTGMGLDQKFNTGNFFNDLLAAQTASRAALLGNASGGWGSGVTIDATIDQYISDYVAAHNT